MKSLQISNTTHQKQNIWTWGHINVQVQKKNKMAPAPRGRLVAVATHNIMILAVLMFLRFWQRNRRTRVRSEYARHILRNRHNYIVGISSVNTRTYPVPSDCEIPWTIPRSAKQRDIELVQVRVSLKWVGDENGLMMMAQLELVNTRAKNLWSPFPLRVL